MILFRLFSLLLLVLFLLNSFLVHASVLTNDQLKKDNLYIEIEVDGGKWYYSLIQVKPNELQETLHTRYADTAQELEIMLKNEFSEKGIPYQLNVLDSITSTVTENRDRVIWKTENEWSWEWEQKYSEWIKANVNQDFFYNNGLATDCADVAITARWIFARINKLPAGQTLSGTSALFTNESFKNSWANLTPHEEWQQDQLFKAALNYVLDNTYTHSLWKDSYSIHVSTETLLPGTHHLNMFGDTGHTMLYVDNLENNIKMIYSDVPRAVRRLYSTSFDSDKPEAGKTGFLKMRWPIKTENGWALKARTEMPHYSQNQYSEELMNNLMENYTYGFLLAMGFNPSPSDYYYNLLTSIWYSFDDRQDIVNTGFEFCSQNDCSPGTPNYSAHSTPARDKRILTKIQKAKTILDRYGANDPDVKYYWDDFISWEMDIHVGSDQYVKKSMADLTAIWEAKTYSYDPRDSVLKRWGISQ